MEKTVKIIHSEKPIGWSQSENACFQPLFTYAVIQSA